MSRVFMLAARLQHPNIVPLHSARESNGLPYFTMPFVDGCAHSDKRCTAARPVSVSRRRYDQA